MAKEKLFAACKLWQKRIKSSVIAKVPDEQEIKKDQADPCWSTALVPSSEKPDLLGTLLEASNQNESCINQENLRSNIDEFQSMVQATGVGKNICSMWYTSNKF